MWAANSPATSSCPMSPPPATGWWRRCRCWRCWRRTASRASEAAHLFNPLPQVLENVRFKKGAPLDDAKVQVLHQGRPSQAGRHGRILVRKSGTEPLIRVMAEGEDEKLVRAVVRQIASAIEEAAA